MLLQYLAGFDSAMNTDLLRAAFSELRFNKSQSLWVLHRLITFSSHHPFLTSDKKNTTAQTHKALLPTLFFFILFFISVLYIGSY